MGLDMVVLTILFGQGTLENVVVTKAAARALENWLRVGKERTYTFSYTDRNNGLEFRTTLVRDAMVGMFETPEVEPDDEVTD